MWRTFDNGRIGPDVRRNISAVYDAFTSVVSGGNTFPVNPTSGQLFVDATTRRIWQWTGTAWVLVGGPTPGVRARRTGTFSLPNVTNVIVGWDTEDYDTDAFHSNTTNNSRLTVPAGLSGLYHAGYAFDFAAAANIGSCWVNVNGGPTRFAWTQGANTGGLVLQGSDFLGLAAGDYIEMSCYQNSGGAITAGSPGSMSFWMYRIGPT